MCGRFSQYSPVSDLVAHFEVDESLVDSTARRPRYNVAPTQQALVIAASSDGVSRKLGDMRWGLVPRWAEDVSIGNRMINARTDRVASSNAYRGAFASRRCLVPVDGFFEWATPPGDAKGPKTPFHIHGRDHSVLALAGLWEIWEDPDGHPLRTFTILTTDANAMMEPIHHRMPVIVEAGDWDAWLAPQPLDEMSRTRILAPNTSTSLVADVVSTLVNRPSNDTPEVIVAR